MIPNNVRAVRVTAAAGTNLACASSADRSTSKLDLLPTDSGLQPEGLHPARGVAPSGFRPLRKILDCSPRRCLGSVSVPVRRATLSRPLPIFALVSHYLANKLIGRRPIPGQ